MSFDFPSFYGSDVETEIPRVPKENDTDSEESH